MAIYNLAFNNSVKQRSAALENYNWTLLIRLIFQTIPSIIKFIMVNSSFKTTNGVKTQTRNFYTRANLLIRNFRYYTDNVKCYLFQSYCTSMYCCQLWFNSTKSSMKKFRTSYNSALRWFPTISKPYSASQMFVSRGIVSFDELLRKSVTGALRELKTVQT